MTTGPIKRVLVTGMSGLIGGAVRRQLEEKYELVALNGHRPVEGVTSHIADIADLDAILPAFEGVHTVIHLAAESSEDSAWQAYRDSNLTGTYNVFEAARMSGVKRVIFASSGSAIKGYEMFPPYDAVVAGRYDEVPASWEKVTHESMPRPNSIYGCTKLWGEAVARMYTDYHGISAICIRIGSVTKEDRPKVTRQFSVWCSQKDIGRFVERCVEAPETLKFDIFYAVSDNKWSYRDMEHAREALGFVPEDSADRFR
jgi:nucleoside-diphosphate-sugar epimerase